MLVVFCSVLMHCVDLTPSISFPVYVELWLMFARLLFFIVYIHYMFRLT
jgi:hypothetical protein